MASISYDGFSVPHKTVSFGRPRHCLECKGGADGNPFGALGVIAGVAVSIAVPFVAPAVATAIFGSSVMAGAWGLLAAAGTGAVLGAAGAYLTGNDWVTGGLLGAAGAGVVQGIGAFGSTAAPLFGAPATGVNAAPTAGLVPGVFGGGGAATAAASAAPAAAAGSGLGSAGAATLGAAAPAAGLGIPWDKVTNAAIAGAPMLLGGVAADVTPPSAEALAFEQQVKDSQAQQQQLYDSSMSTAAGMDPSYAAENAANAARLHVAQQAQEGNRQLNSSSYDPQRHTSINRRAAVDATAAAGTAYTDAWLRGQTAQDAAYSKAGLLKPNPGTYADLLAKYGVNAERDKRAENYADMISPFATAFLKSA